MIKEQFSNIWEQLRSKKPHMPHFLDEVRINGLRGLQNLNVRFEYPVSVIAGANATGKSTVLFALACAYKVPKASIYDYKPATMFPGYHPKSGGEHNDTTNEISLRYRYSTKDGGMDMIWKYKKSWTRSFFGRKGAKQPERALYLRTLSHLSNPSEIRSVLTMSYSDKPPEEEALTVDQIAFAHTVFPWKYNHIIRLTDARNSKRNLLFAKKRDNVSYSEFHMASGERSVIRLAMEIAQLKDALVLIDELETGLHPYAQQMLMLYLQRLALRNGLQIVLTTHSPVVLDSVPSEACILLDRSDDGSVKILEPFRDLIQNALYGRSHDKLKLLCEDQMAEAILYGIIDYIAPSENIRHTDIQIGRDTGAEQFNNHANMVKKFDRLNEFLFILDGDQQNKPSHKKLRETVLRESSILFLPGEGSPELWVWQTLSNNTQEASGYLNTTQENLRKYIQKADGIFQENDDSKSAFAKGKLRSLADELAHNDYGQKICRALAHHEAGNPKSEIQPLVGNLRDELNRWRRLNS